MADEESGARECLRGRLMPVFEPQKVRLLRISEDSFIVRREEDKKVFRLKIRNRIEKINGREFQRGTIEDVNDFKRK